MRNWGFLTNHAHVLIQIARDPRSTIRQIAFSTGITERAAINVLQDLRGAGIVVARRDGRQNVYRINAAALAAHHPWGASGMEIPQALIDATLRGLAQVAAGSGVVEPRAKARPARSTRQGRCPPGKGRRWGFLTTHALILIFVTQHPRSTVREIALAVGVTERAAHAALQDLHGAGITQRKREGRRNSYTLDFHRLAAYRREGTAPDLVPGAFVSSLIDALLALRPAL